MRLHTIGIMFALSPLVHAEAPLLVDNGRAVAVVVLPAQPDENEQQAASGGSTSTRQALGRASVGSVLATSTRFGPGSRRSA